MTAAEVRSLFARLAEAFAGARDRLGQLDAAVGDGDHGVGMARGFAAAAAAIAAEDAAEPGALFTRAGAALMSAVGGASGPLFATIFLEIGKALAADAAGVNDPGDGDNDGDHRDDVALRISSGLASAAERIQRLGRSGPGDKTLLEALLPAAEAFHGQVAVGLDAALAAAATAAELGANASADLPAKRGRARYVEGAGLGHPDPGAVSIALLFTTWNEGTEGEEGVA